MSTKSTAPAPMEAPTPDATSVARQLQSQLGNKATVTATGSAVNVWSKYWLLEQQMSSLKVTVAATSVPPTLNEISFSIKDAQGNTVDLEDSDPAASSYYAFNFKQSAFTAYNAALGRGDAYYTVNFSSPSVIDRITALFGPDENTLNKPKTVAAFTMECDPTKVYNGYKGGPYFNQ
jgi:hypothetical protein